MAAILYSMLSGKAYARAFRVHFLVQVALTYTYAAVTIKCCAGEGQDTTLPPYLPSGTIQYVMLLENQLLADSWAALWRPWK